MSAYQALYEEGLEAQKHNSYEKALDCYYKIAAEDEAFPALYNNMAMCMKATGQMRQALTIMAKATLTLPNQPELILNYARLLSEEEKWTEVERILAPLMQKDNPDGETLFLMGKLHLANKNSQLAYECSAKAHEIDPDKLSYIILLTTCLYELDREPEATAFINLLMKRDIKDISIKVLILGLLNSINEYEKSIAYYETGGFTKNVNVEAEFYLGQAYKGLKNYKKAEEVFNDLLRRDPTYVDGYRGLGEVMMGFEEFDKAEDFFKKALEIKPNYPEVINAYGLVLRDMDRLEDAEKLYLQAIALDDTRPELWVNLASLMNHGRRYKEAVAANMKAIEIRPSFLTAVSNLIGTLREMGESEQALEWLDILLEQSPGHLAGHTSKAFLNLTLGNTQEGWEAYEIRKSLNDQFHLTESDLPESVKFWEGENLAGKRIFIASEQGIGDEIMFASCFQDIIDRAAFTLIECEKRLLSLFQRSFPKAVFVPRHSLYDGKGKVTGRSLHELDTHMPLDYVISAGSLPKFLRNSIEDFPQRESYLVADPAYVEAWGKRMAEFEDKLKVGLCWRSGNQNFMRRKYYLDLKKMAPLFKVPDIQVFNLQYGEADAEIAESKQDITTFEGLNLKDDFEHVAALMMHLDCVVTAATSMGELAGALGRRVIRFEGGPDWTRLGQPERPWYAHMTSLRRIGETYWEPLVDEAVKLLSP